ncbi:type III pantothenate kinase [Ereboglobus luteus]|uniref:Type III pantothenate kinase n=1 Tax=Ereboglobus luteus TaxID=1796921 RepID=A0A2U8E1P3_9BACT|nr:type III pantothenate kinase [Ereboglobus luteus]AWI08798.1 type III pantothenate kinase [Ereboglobus luteus]
MLLCIDIGNTHTHYGVVAEGEGARAQYDTPTRTLEDAASGIGPKIADLLARQPGIIGLAYCSVVPAATEALRRVLARDRFSLPALHLTHDKKLGVPITYPRPGEIGQDRLANAAAARLLGELPAIVIDMGTAVTFDIITRAHGYEGGIIAPGVELMRRYLHEQTAQLPLLDESIDVTRAVGQSTIEAMRIGTVVGFGGMIQALLDTVIADLAKRGETNPRIYSTGGSAALLRDRLKTPFEVIPDLTLRGLAAAWKLNVARA